MTKSDRKHITFTVFGVPVPKARARVSAALKKNGRRYTYTPERTRKAELDFITQAAIHAPETPFSGPITLSAAFHMPIPKSWPKWRKDEAMEYNIRPTCKPDIDNLVKLTMDAMNGIFWHDDAQIVSISATKCYSDDPRIAIYLKEI
jgi:Holliday junction resolvase RusA-like endonuclease